MRKIRRAEITRANTVYAFLVCVHEIQMNARPEKHVNICSDNQMALKALQAVKQRLHLYDSTKS